MPLKIQGQIFKTKQDALNELRTSRKRLSRAMEDQDFQRAMDEHGVSAPTFREITVIEGTKAKRYRFEEFTDPFLDLLRPYLKHHGGRKN